MYLMYTRCTLCSLTTLTFDVGSTKCDKGSVTVETGRVSRGVRLTPGPCLCTNPLVGKEESEVAVHVVKSRRFVSRPTKDTKKQKIYEDPP